MLMSVVSLKNDIFTAFKLLIIENHKLYRFRNFSRSGLDRRPNRGVMDPSIALFTEVLCGTIRRMTTLAFDTHKAVKALKEAGFDDPQAEAVVATVGEAIGGSIATKADIAEVRTTTKTDIAQLRAEMKTDIAQLRAEMADQFSILYRHLWSMAIGIVGFTAGLTVALVKLLP